MSRRREEYGRGTAAQRGYGSRWQTARATYLRSHPLCVLHQRRGEVVEATVVDHVIPHRGDPALFWDTDNWQALCASCHSAVKQAEEKGAGLRGFDVDGNPLDHNHRWNR